MPKAHEAAITERNAKQRAIRLAHEARRRIAAKPF
jgi:hypothetical protein